MLEATRVTESKFCSKVQLGFLGETMETVETKLSVHLTCPAQSPFFPQRGLGMSFKLPYDMSPTKTLLPQSPSLYVVSCFKLQCLDTTSQQLSCWYTVWYAMRFICNHKQHSFFEGHSQQSSNSCLRSTKCDIVFYSNYIGLLHVFFM